MPTARLASSSPRRLAVALTVAGALAFAPAASAVPDGGYIGLGLGGAVASGDRGVPLDVSGFTIAAAPGTPGYDERVRTDFGSGLAAELRFGWLIAGVIAPEASVSGHGATSFEDGAGFATFILRYHPAQHAIDHLDRAWDLNVYAGVGYAIAGFHPDPAIAIGDDDGKGWEGVAVVTGLGFAYQVADSVSLGLDVKIALPQYSSYIWNYDDDLRADASETPSTMVVMPTLQVVFHL